MPIKHALTCPAQSIACQFCFKSKSIEEGITKPRYTVLKFERYLNQGAVECPPYSLNYQLMDEWKCCKISACLMKVYKVILLFKCWLLRSASWLAAMLKMTLARQFLVTQLFCFFIFFAVLFSVSYG